MAEYIEKQVAVEIAMQYCPDDDGSCSRAGEDIRDLLDELENLPPADVRPVVRGRWELDSRSMYSCSCCGQSAPYDVQADIIEYWPHLNYCPNCGSYNGGDISVDE